MTDVIKKRGESLEAKYFCDQEIKALEGLTLKASARKSPISGEPMNSYLSRC